jgi:hypothetical protein
LTTGLVYRFYLTATNSKGETTYSEESRFAAAPLPNQPLDLDTLYTTKTSITLKWTASSTEVIPITGYVLEINDLTETLST